MGVVVQKLRDSAKGQPCQLQSPYCNSNKETTVLAHLPNRRRGIGQKGDDWHAVFACSSCHEALDLRRMEPALEWSLCIEALRRTQRIWYELGLMIFPIMPEKPFRSSKSLPPKPSWRKRPIDR